MEVWKSLILIQLTIMIFTMWELHVYAMSILVSPITQSYSVLYKPFLNSVQNILPLLRWCHSAPVPVFQASSKQTQEVPLTLVLFWNAKISVPDAVEKCPKCQNVYCNVLIQVKDCCVRESWENPGFHEIWLAYITLYYSTSFGVLCDSV